MLLWNSLRDDAQVWHTNVPIWALLLALVLPIIYVLPSGFIFAMTGQPVSEQLPLEMKRN